MTEQRNMIDIAKLELRKVLKIIFLSLFSILGSASYGQVSNPSIIPVTTAPAGSCSGVLPNRQVISTGIIYSCQNIIGGVGTWGDLLAGGNLVSPLNVGSGAFSGSFSGRTIYPSSTSQISGIPLYQISNLFYGWGNSSPTGGSILIVPTGTRPTAYGIRVSDGAVVRYGIELMANSAGTSRSASLRMCGRWSSGYCTEMLQEGAYLDMTVTGTFFRWGGNNVPFFDINSTSFLGWDKTLGTTEAWSSSKMAWATNRTTQLPDGTNNFMHMDTTGCVSWGSSETCSSNPGHVNQSGDATFNTVSTGQVTATSPESITSANCLAASAVSTPCGVLAVEASSQTSTYTASAVTIGTSGGKFSLKFNIGVSACSSCTVTAQLSGTTWDNIALTNYAIASRTSTGFIQVSSPLDLKAGSTLTPSCAISGTSATINCSIWLVREN